tara:strand:+ start:2707 stop:2898 length:192 start_codon:yes stop_codon:yes gene_type:complete
MKQNIKELMNEHRQTKEFQKNASSPVKYENDFITGLKLLRKKYPNDALFGAEVDKLLKDGNNI